MTNSSAWIGASTTVPHAVHVGTWINWSRGRIMGATLTLGREHGALLIAFTAFFVSLVASCFWRILCLTYHQFRSTSESRDALHHQEQTTLRNSLSASSGLWSLLQIGWTWRRGGEAGRTIPGILLAVLTVIAFTIAGGLSSQISSGISNEVLLDGGNCGYVMSIEQTGSYDDIGILYPYSVLEVKSAANYAQQCYSNASSMLDCTTFVKSHLPGTIDTDAPCPFNESICRSESNLLLDSGYIDSMEDLGINASPERRILYRTMLHCAPLVTDGYSSNDSTSYNNYTRYFYGGQWQASNNQTYQIRDLHSQYYSEFDNTQRNQGANFHLVHSYAGVLNGSTHPPWSEFIPVPELFRSDGDLHLIFLSGNEVYFLEETNDPWYRGVRPSEIHATSRDGHLHSIYQPAEAASPLACVEQYQFCNAFGECGRLSGLRDAALSTAPLFNATAEMLYDEEEVTGQMASQYYWYFVSINKAFQAFSILINGLGALSLDSQQYLLSGIMGPLPPAQWQRDVTLWWATLLASQQAEFVTTATGPVDPILQQFKKQPNNTYMADMCNNQKIHSTGYTSFSLFGLYFTYITGALIIVLSYTLEPLLSCLHKRNRYNEYKYLEWTADSTLQLQRLAYQGLGSGTWTGYTDSVPRTMYPEKLKHLPQSYPQSIDYHNSMQKNEVVQDQNTTDSLKSGPATQDDAPSPHFPHVRPSLPTRWNSI